MAGWATPTHMVLSNWRCWDVSPEYSRKMHWMLSCKESAVSCPLSFCRVKWTWCQVTAYWILWVSWSGGAQDCFWWPSVWNGCIPRPQGMSLFKFNRSWGKKTFQNTHDTLDSLQLVGSYEPAVLSSSHCSSSPLHLVYLDTHFWKSGECVMISPYDFSLLGGCAGSLFLPAGFLKLQRIGATLWLWCEGFSLSGFACCRAQALGQWASVAVSQRLSCPRACGIFPDQESNPCLLHRQLDSLPLSHQENTVAFSFYF